MPSNQPPAAPTSPSARSKSIVERLTKLAPERRMALVSVALGHVSKGHPGEFKDCGLCLEPSRPWSSLITNSTPPETTP